MKLEDASGFTWDISKAGGYVATGGTDAVAEKPFDWFNYVWVDPDTEADLDNYWKPVNPTLDNVGNSTIVPDCEHDDGGREIEFPPVDVGNDIEVTRKVYVPAPSSGEAFARWVTFIRNKNTTQARTVDLDMEGELGGDEGDATIMGDSSGDGRSDEADRWIVTDDEARETSTFEAAPAVAMNWDLAIPAPLIDDADDIVGPISGLNRLYTSAQWKNVAIAADQTAAIMQIVSQHETAAEAVDAAEDFAKGPDAIYAGLDDDERDQLRNWGRDGDGDGDENAADNCPANANADQADLDNDGTGNACDNDIDGDGLDNATEGNLGTSASLRDSDGDSFADNRDRCPLEAGPGGCPVTVQNVDRPGPTQFVTQSLQAQVAKRVAPRAISLSTRARRAGKVVRLSSSGRLTLPSGVSAAQACSGGAIAVVVKSGKRTVSTRFVELIAPACRFTSAVRFSLPSRLGKRPLQIRAYFLGNNFLTKKTSKLARPTIR